LADNYRFSFGGKYIVRFLASGKGLNVGFTAHPAGVVAEEWQAISGPLSIGFGGMLSSPRFLFQGFEGREMLRPEQNWMDLTTRHNEQQQKQFFRGKMQLIRPPCILVLNMDLL
jgi:hypothetical protein